MRKALLVGVNLAITAAIFGYLFRHVRPGDVLDLLRNMDRRAVAMFVVLSLATSLFRLWRYRVLLRLSGYDPPPFPLFLMVLGLSLLLQPAVSAVLGWVLFGEWLSVTDMVGTMAVAAALVLVRLPSRA